jgi:hypothetical protein
VILATLYLAVAKNINNLYLQLSHMRPSTPSVGYYIVLPRLIVDSKIIILDKLQPSPLPKVQVRLHEDVLQTLMVRI